MVNSWCADLCDIVIKIQTSELKKNLKKMSIDLGQIDQIDYRESIRRKLSTKRQNSNRQDVAWGGSLRNLVVQQSFIRVRIIF